jgi:hypothetical protein
MNECILNLSKWPWVAEILRSACEAISSFARRKTDDEFMGQVSLYDIRCRTNPRRTSELIDSGSQKIKILGN